MPSRAYNIVVGKLFEDLEFLQELKVFQLEKEAQYRGRSDENKRYLIGRGLKVLIKDKYNINLSKHDVELLLEPRGDRKLNRLDEIFSARVELGTGPKGYP